MTLDIPQPLTSYGSKIVPFGEQKSYNIDYSLVHLFDDGPKEIRKNGRIKKEEER